MMDNPWLIPAVGAAALGLLIGGVVNWLADRLILEQPLGGPLYPDGYTRSPAAWLGVWAYLFGLRLSPEGTPLSLRYPITEIVLSALFAYITVAFPIGWRTIFYCGNVAILVLITIIDLEHRWILWSVIIPGCLWAVLGAWVAGPEISNNIAFKDYLLGGLLGGVVFGLMYLGGRWFNYASQTEETAFGYGDVLLGTLSGLMLGWASMIYAIFIAVLAGGLGAVIYILVRLLGRGKYDLYTALPYGQYIVFGTLLMMLWQAPILSYWQGF